MTVNFFGGALFAGIGAYLLVEALAALSGARRSRHWASIPGRVVESQVQKHPGVDGPSYRAEIRYVYTVAGHEYVGSRASFASFMHSSLRGRAARLVRRFPKGASVAVFHDPDDPQESVLVTGFNRDVVGVSVLALAFILMGMWVMATT